MNNEHLQWSPPKPPHYPVGKKELWFAGCVLLLSLLSTNGVLYGGLNLAFAAGAVALVLTIGVFLIKSKKRPTAYGASLVVLALIIAAGFSRSNDGFVKGIVLPFMLLAVSMAFTIAADKNRNDGRSIEAVGSALLLLLTCGIGGIPRSVGGLFGALRSGKGKNMLAVLGGLAITVPVLLILVPLLVKADAAFDGMMGLFPELQLSELLGTVFWGLCAAMALFSFGLSLVHGDPDARNTSSSFKGMNPVTVCTVLIMVDSVYLLYLISQLAYLVGGLSGILPENFTLAQYARRGFFEMALLCLVNLVVMVGSIALIRKEKGIPGLCRWLCAFIGLICLFFVVSAGAKMGLYIRGYGLTRLRILTLVITLFLGLCSLTVTLWLFVPRVHYMKVILLSAMVLGAAVLWVDVDTVAASYNVNAYLEGRLEFVDVEYLGTLSDGAVPYIQKLTGASDRQVAQAAERLLQNRDRAYEDIRGWNYASWKAGQILNKGQ